MGGASNEPSASDSMGDKNLKCVVQHHCTDLIEVFKQNLVHFANEFWSCNVITGAAKDNLLDPSKGGADLRASNLVSSICSTLSSLRNIRAQSVHMLFLLSILEKADELTLATNMRIEVAKMGIDLPPRWSTPVSDHDIKEREFYSEQVEITNHDDYVYGVDPVYESRKRGSGPFIVPPRTRQPKHVVLLTNSSLRHSHKTDPVIPYNAGTLGRGHPFHEREFSKNHFPLSPVPESETQPHTTKNTRLLHPKSSVGCTEQHDGQTQGSLDKSRQYWDKLHVQEQKEICNGLLIMNYKEEIVDLKKRLAEKDEQIQQHNIYDRIEAEHRNIIAKYELEIKDLRSRLEEREQTVRQQQEKTAEHDKMIIRYELEIKDLRTRLEEREQERTESEKTEATYNKLIGRYEQEAKDLQTRLHQLQVKYDVLMEDKVNEKQRKEKENLINETDAILLEREKRFETQELDRNRLLKERERQLETREQERKSLVKERQIYSLIFHIVIVIITLSWYFSRS